MATDSQSLYEQAKCYICFGVSEFEALELALLAQIAGGSGPPVPVAPNVPTNLDITIASVNGSTILTWSNSDVPTTNEIWSSADNITFAFLASVGGGIHTYTDVTVLAINTRRYYKVKACNVDCSVFTSVVSAARDINYGGAAGVTISEPTLKVIYGNYDFSGSGALTTVTLAAVRKITGSFLGTGCGALTSFTANSLITVGNSIDVSFNAALTVYSTTSLTNLAGGLFLGGTMIVVLMLPLLTGAGNDVQIQSNNVLTTVDFTNFTTAGGNIVASDCPLMTTFTLTNLGTVAGRLDVGNNVSLTVLSAPKANSIFDSVVGVSSGLVTLNLPMLVNLGTDMDFDSAASLSVVNVNVVNFPDGHVINFPGCALNQASVDLILSRGVASGTTASDYELFGGTSATPSAAGLINKGLLIGAGNTVNTN